MAHQSISPSAALVLSLPLMAAPAVLAQEKNQDDQALDQAANDPTASLMNIQIQNIYTDSY